MSYTPLVGAVSFRNPTSYKLAAFKLREALGGYPMHILDADKLAREIVQPGEPALGQIVQAFGPRFFARKAR